MNKKLLSRLAALSMAAASAVSAFGITASADVLIPDWSNPTKATISELWYVNYSVDGGSTYTTGYYDTKAHADAATIGAIVRSGPTQVSPAIVLTYNDKFNLTSTGQVVKDSYGSLTYIGTSYVSAGSATGGNVQALMNSITYLYAQDTCVISTPTGRCYPNWTAMYQVEGDVSYTTKNIDSAYRWSATKRYFDYTYGVYSETPTATCIIITNSGNSISPYYISTSHRTSSNVVYYCGGVYYPNYNNMVASLGRTPHTSEYTTKTLSASEQFTTSRNYFDPQTGCYYVSAKDRPYAVLIGYSGTGSYTVYYSGYTQKYYDTSASATAATPAGYTVTTIPNSYYPASTLNNYGYSPYNNANFYPGITTTTTVGNGTSNSSTSNNTATVKDNSNVTMGKSKGWTNITKQITSAKSGASFTVNMNNEYEIPASFLKALKGKDVTVSFKFSSGALLTVNGKGISAADSSVFTDVQYNVKKIPTSLVKKAVKANSGVSSSQLSIGGGTFDLSASLTIKFKTTRAGCSAKLYRYNAANNSLKAVSNSTVKEDGTCVFNGITQGGSYIAILS